MNKLAINERSQQILKTLVTRYIRDGQPVGSKTIAQDACVALSSASIRNILVELEDAGFVKSPHTSAGRVPTNLGYRFFVNNLLQVKNNLSTQDVEDLPGQLSGYTSEQELVESASTLVSSMTKLTGIVTIPRHDKMTFRHIEFLPLSQNRVLVILRKRRRKKKKKKKQQAANFLVFTTMVRIY